MIHPEIWQSEDFSKLSLFARLLFIGMFSMADDYGKGRAKPVYLKSVIFPYDDGMRIIDVEKALSEIGSNMSVTFYAHDGNDYYRLDNWESWQKVDKPQSSKIPDPFQNDSENSTERFDENSRMILEKVQNYSEQNQEQFQNDSENFSLSIREENKKRKEEKRDAREARTLTLSFGEFRNVKLTQEEYDNLVGRFEEWVISDKIDYLDSKIESGIRKYCDYKNHYVTILNWCKKDNPAQPETHKKLDDDGEVDYTQWQN